MSEENEIIVALYNSCIKTIHTSGQCVLIVSLYSDSVTQMIKDIYEQKRVPASKEIACEIVKVNTEAQRTGAPPIVWI